jgi:D-glycero-alpha-D-manno-heptose-7-phosphate kinase
VRICDVGGWTDTWFARVGAVLSIAVRPLVEVSVATTPRGAGHQVVLHAPDLDQRDAFDLVAKPGRQPLLEAALEAARLPDDVTVEITIRAGVPPGSGTGTSAAVVVALLGACDRLTPGVTPPLEIARAAHRVETVELGQQSGVQDQLAAACGGINLIEVRYPDADVHRVTVPRPAAEALERRLVLVSLGHPHRSSDIHEDVIARLGAGGGRAELDVLRSAARSAASALGSGVLEDLGGAMTTATEATRSLHPALVSDEAEALIEAARRSGASGWKPNGAGGDGGSLTLLAGPGPGATERLLEAVAGIPGPHAVLPVRLAHHGLLVTTGG